MNRKQLGFKLNVNHFADLSDDEYGTHRGLSFDTLKETEEFEKKIPVLSLDDSETRFVYNQPVSYEEREHEDLHPVSSSSKDKTEDKSDIEVGKLKARCEKGSDCNTAVLNNIEDITEGSAYIPEQSERVSKTIAMNSLSSSADSNLQQKSSVVSPEELKFDQLWSPPDGKAAKPFFMFGVDKSGSFTGQPVLETYERDYYFKDDSKFPAEFRHWNNRSKKKSRQDFAKKAQEQIPENLDWREYGAVSPIQSQGICGSCWSFSTAAAVESAHFLKTGKLKKLSEQHLIDCTWYVPHSKDGNHACMGGWTWKSFAYIKKFGIATTESYGKYVGMESSCKTRNITEGATIDSFMKVKANDAKALKRAIAIYGPATASINTETKTLKFYSSGVYNDRECTGNTDHSVLIVGYGKKNGKLYWIVRNSWGTAWGKKGYIKIENGKCGLLKKPWVIINRHRQPLPWMREAAS